MHFRRLITAVVSTFQKGYFICFDEGEKVKIFYFTICDCFSSTSAYFVWIWGSRVFSRTIVFRDNISLKFVNKTRQNWEVQSKVLDADRLVEEAILSCRSAAN